MNDQQVLEELVRLELSLILQFREIRNSQVLSKFLEFVVEKKLSGQEDEIKEYTIAVKALGKPRDFNPQLDASIRIHAGRLRRILAQYYQETGHVHAVVIDIPKGAYIPTFIKTNGHNGHEVILPSQLQPDIIYTETVNELLELRKKPIVAVLPFHNLSSDHSKDYFVAGIGEQMTTDLARFQNISVISYFSTSSYNGELKDLHEMKKDVNIDYVLTGGVRFINEMVKLNVHLVLTGNGEIIFTETYTRHLTPENVFEIQDEIVSEVLNIIADDYGIINMNMAHASPVTKPENISTQDAIYKYFDYTRDFSTEKFQAAFGALTNAVQTQSPNALASALLAGLYMDMYISDETEDRALLDKAIALAHVSVELDPLCQHSQKVLAWGYLLSGKKEKSFEAIEQCIKLNPKASSIVATMALAYICQGDYIRGFKWLLESMHLNPTPPGNAKFSFGLFYYHNKEYNESVKWIERMSHLDTPFLKLMHLSLYGKMNNTKKKDIDKSVLSLKGKALNIIDRIVFDDELKMEIVDGLQVAGLTVK